MSETLVFTEQPNSDPWANPDWALTAPGALRVQDGALQLAVNPSATSAIRNAVFSAERALSVRAAGSNVITWTTSGARSHLWIDYVDEQTHLRLDMIRANTDQNRLRIVRTAGGADLPVIWEGGTMADALVAQAGFTLKFSVTESVEDGELDIDISAGVEGGLIYTATPTITYAPAGRPGIYFRRNSSSNFLRVYEIAVSGSGLMGSPAILPQGGSAASQLQLKSFTLANFESTPTSATINGESVAFTLDGETASLRIPGHLATGSYTVTFSNDDESASTTINVTQTYPIAAPDASDLLDPSTNYDSRSIYSGVGTSFPSGTWDALPTVFTKVGGAGETITIQFKAPYTGWHDAPLADNVADYLELPAGSTGEYSASAEKLFPDGSTLTWEISLQAVSEQPQPVITIYYVSTASSNGYAVGADDNDGLSKAAPFATLEHARSVAAEGDVVMANVGVTSDALQFVRVTRLRRGSEALTVVSGAGGARAIVSPIVQAIAN